MRNKGELLEGESEVSGSVIPVPVYRFREGAGGKEG